MTGYTAGVWDLFHVGHLRMLQRVRRMCDVMIVGVSVDELVEQVKGHKPVFPYHERLEILNGLGWIDAVVPQYDLDKYEAWKRMGFDTLFVGDDHYEELNWQTWERKLVAEGVNVIYLPYARHISTTQLRKRLHDEI